MDDIEVFKQVFPDKYFYEFWLKNKRPDGREFTQLRKASITRSGTAGFIISSGNNVVQSTYEVQQAKVKINTDARSSLEHLYEKITIQFAQEASFPLFASYLNHLKKIIVNTYEQQLSALKLQEKIVIDISALFHDGSLLSPVMLSIMVALYECFVNKCGVQAETLELLFPLVIKTFYIPEKDALLWLWDPSKEELTLDASVLSGATYFAVMSLSTTKLSLEKIEGADMSLDDLANTAALFKDNLDRPAIRAALLNYLRDITTPSHRLI